MSKSLKLLAGDFLVIVNGRQVFGSFDVAAMVWDGKFVFVLFAEGGEAEFGRRLASEFVTFDFVLDTHEAFEERFGARRTAGDVDIDGDDEVDTFDDVITPFEVRAAASGAGTHGDDELGIGHHVIEAADAAGHFVRNGAGDNHQVGLAGRGAEGTRAETVHIEAAGTGGHHFNRTAGQTEREGPNAGLTGPVDGVLDRSGDDVLFEAAFDPRLGDGWWRHFNPLLYENGKLISPLL